MSKDPAFLFYPNDYLGGTMGMTFEQKGAYVDLLIFQFNNHQFTESQAKHMLSTSFSSAWQVLQSKFKKEGEFYYNERLRDEINKRKAFTESRRINALHPKKPRKAYAKHMGNRNRYINIDINNKKEAIILPDWVPIDTFTEYNLQRKKKLKPQSINRFLKSLKKICDETKASPEDILNQSIVNGWEGIFPLKENKNANTRPISYRRNNQERQLDPNTAEELDRAVAEYERKTALREAGKIS